MKRVNRTHYLLQMVFNSLAILVATVVDVVFVVFVVAYATRLEFHIITIDTDARANKNEIISLCVCWLILVAVVKSTHIR